MNMIDVIRASHPVGMSSLGAARKVERELMAHTLQSIESLLSSLHTAAVTSEVMEGNLIELADGIKSAMHDAGVSREHWEAKIGDMT